MEEAATEEVEALNSREGEEEEDVERSGKRRRVGDVGGSEIRVATEGLSFLCSSDDKSVSTSAFLSVSNLLLLVLDKVGPTMAVLRQDVQRNIERLEDMFVSDPREYQNLVEILKKEKNGKIAKKNTSCSRAVVWLTRSLDFGMDLLSRLMEDTELSLEEAVEEAYNNNFRPWHGWIAAAAYKVALKLLPDRKNFTELLMGKGQDHTLLREDIQILVSLLQPFLNDIHSHLEALELNKFKSDWM